MIKKRDIATEAILKKHPNLWIRWAVPAIVAVGLTTAMHFGLVNPEKRIAIQTQRAQIAAEALSAKKEWAKQRLLEIDEELLACPEHARLSFCIESAQVKRKKVDIEVISAEEDFRSSKVQLLNDRFNAKLQIPSLFLVFITLGHLLGSIIDDHIRFKKLKKMRSELSQDLTALEDHASALLKSGEQA